MEDPEYARFGIYEQTAPRPSDAEPRVTRLPLELKPGTRIALIGNTLFDRSQHFGHIESLIYQRYPSHHLVIRNLSWSGDSIDVRPRPENFADLFQHLHHEKIDVILAAFGFNESFAGPEGIDSFREKLAEFLDQLRSKAFNGTTTAEVVLVSPIANEDLPNVSAGSLNNENLRLYTQAMREVASAKGVGFIDSFDSTEYLLADPATTLTINGIHLNEARLQRVCSGSLSRTVSRDATPSRRSSSRVDG